MERVVRICICVILMENDTRNGGFLGVFFSLEWFEVFQGKGTP